MIPYYILFLLIYLGAYYDFCYGDSLQIQKSVKTLFYFTVISFIIIITSLKGNVGTDYNSYYNLYSVWGTKKYTGFVTLQMEFGFWLISHIFNFFNLPFAFFWFFLSCLTLITKFIFIRKFSPFFFLSLLIYLSGLYIERDFDGIRQGFSIGLAYISILYYFDKKRIHFFVFLLFAISIHYTSLIFLSIPILTKIELSNKRIFVLIGIGFVIYVLKMDVISFLQRLLPTQSYISQKINTYLAAGIFSGNAGIKLGIIIRIIILYLFCNIDYKSISIDYSVYNFLRNGFMLSILCFLFFNNMEIIAHRLAYGFRELQIIIIPYCFQYYVIHKSYFRKFKLIAFQVYCLYAFVLFYRMINAPGLKPYYKYHFVF